MCQNQVGFNLQSNIVPLGSDLRLNNPFKTTYSRNTHPLRFTTDGQPSSYWYARVPIAYRARLLSYRSVAADEHKKKWYSCPRQTRNNLLLTTLRNCLTEPVILASVSFPKWNRPARWIRSSCDCHYLQAKTECMNCFQTSSIFAVQKSKYSTACYVKSDLSKYKDAKSSTFSQIQAVFEIDSLLGFGTE